MITVITLCWRIIPAIIFSMNRVVIVIGIVLISLVSGCSRSSQSPQGGLETPQSSTIVNKGSDTLVNLALAWAEKYHELHPDVEITVTGGGSGTGIAALINKTVDIANASRQIKPEEMSQAEKNGTKPVEFVVAKDAIAIIVNPNNPV